MGIKIGNNNKINNSIIENNNQEKEEKTFCKMLIEIVVAIISGLIVGYIIYKFDWN